MPFIKRKWTPDEADEWSKEEIYACIISPLAYVTLTIGIMLSLFLLWYGFIILIAGIILTFLLFYIIDPKLSVISDEYEKKQKEYLKILDKIIKWKEIK